MTRLTRKVDKEWHYEIDYHTIDGDHTALGDLKFVKKLGQLEDIEEELGIDVITLFKAQGGIRNMKEFIKCRDVIVNKRNIQCVSIGCVIAGKCNICIELNDSFAKPIYIMCNNEAEARKEFDNIYKQLQEEDNENTKDTEESQPQKYKITLKEFWESDRDLAIHCNTEEEAKKLLKAFDKLGKKWSNGKSYLEQNLWSLYNRNTCYNNGNKYCDYDFYKNRNYTIYEFEDVDLDN